VQVQSAGVWHVASGNRGASADSSRCPAMAVAASHAFRHGTTDTQ